MSLGITADQVELDPASRAAAEERLGLLYDLRRKYGDTIENMDFPYLEKATKLNVAALAALASAPPPPEPTGVAGGTPTPVCRSTWCTPTCRCSARSW